MKKEEQEYKYPHRLMVICRHPKTAQKAALKQYYKKLGFGGKILDKAIVDEERISFIVGFKDIKSMDKFWTKTIPRSIAEMLMTLKVTIMGLEKVPMKSTKKKAKALQKFVDVVEKEGDLMIVKELFGGKE